MMIHSMESLVENMYWMYLCLHVLFLTKYHPFTVLNTIWILPSIMGYIPRVISVYFASGLLKFSTRQPILDHLTTLSNPV